MDVMISAIPEATKDKEGLMFAPSVAEAGQDPRRMQCTTVYKKYAPQRVRIRDRLAWTRRMPALDTNQDSMILQA